MLFKYTQNKNPQKTHLCLFLGAQFKIIAQIFFYIFKLLKNYFNNDRGQPQSWTSSGKKQGFSSARYSTG